MSPDGATMKTTTRVCVCGLGYVGLPLALAFSRHFETVGYDVDQTRIANLASGVDPTGMLDGENLKQVRSIRFTSNPAELAGCTLFLIAVPTPIDENSEPDLSLLRQATQVVGRILRKGATVVVESTVYPGATEEVCLPILEAESGLELDRDFSLGFAPERINPGDPDHQLGDVVKVVSATTAETSQRLAELYRVVIPAGVHIAESIRVAEAAKLLENTQRDVNIALMNEFAHICRRLELDVEEVRRTAATKWNFLPFHPGLVGGHCTPVDPHYLRHRAERAGVSPQLIPLARAVNDGVAGRLADLLAQHLADTGRSLDRASVLQLGFAFKANCSDTRNSGAMELARQLQMRGARVSLFDPRVPADGIAPPDAPEVIRDPDLAKYDAIVVAVGHSEFRELGATGARAYGRKDHVLFDTARIFPREQCDLVY